MQPHLQLPTLLASTPSLPPHQPQALHCEQNRFGVLPVGPYLCGLRELLLGWDQALRSPAALHAAARLSRLVLWRTALHDAPMDPVIDLPVEAGEALVETLAAMPALRRVDDNMKHPGTFVHGLCMGAGLCMGLQGQAQRLPAGKLHFAMLHVLRVVAHCTRTTSRRLPATSTIDLLLCASGIPAGSYLLWPAVAQAMWRMGQRCPHLQLGVLQSKSIGWGMSRLRKAEEEEEEEQQQQEGEEREGQEEQ